MIAESWVNSPDDLLPGVLWRGFLLSEGSGAIRRRSQQPFRRCSSGHGGERNENWSRCSTRARCAKRTQVFVGGFGGIYGCACASARLTDFPGRVQPTWISSDKHPIATEVTRRDTAMLRTADEFRVAGERLVKAFG